MSFEYALDIIQRGIFRAVLGALCILSMLTPFGELLDSTLTLHMMVQHFFYLTGGFPHHDAFHLHHSRGLGVLWSGFVDGENAACTASCSGKAMGIFGAFLMFTTLHVYPVYPAPEQAETGLIMVVMMLVMDLIIVPYWLYKYFGKQPTQVMKKV